MKFSGMVKPEIDDILSLAHFTNDEEIIFKALTRNKSIVEISIETGMSTATVSRRIKGIKEKISRL